MLKRFLWVCFFVGCCGHVNGAEISPGLYMRTMYAFGNLAIDSFYISNDHRIAMNANHGADPFDFAEAIKEYPRNVGTFTQTGNKLSIKWGGGKQAQTLEAEFDHDTLSAFDGGLVTKAAAYPKDHRLNAEFAGSAATANVSAASTLTLKEDGTYSVTGFGAVHGTPGGSAKSESTESGTYTLTGNTLALTSGGKLHKHTAIPFNTEEGPKAKIGDQHMILDGMNMKRVK